MHVSIQNTRLHEYRLPQKSWTLYVLQRSHTYFHCHTHKQVHPGVTRQFLIFLGLGRGIKPDINEGSRICTLTECKSIKTKEAKCKAGKTNF